MYKILNLVDEHGEIITYAPSLRDQVAEIAAAIKDDRATNLRRALNNLRPRQTPRPPSGDVLVTSLFALREDN